MDVIDYRFGWLGREIVFRDCFSKINSKYASDFSTITRYENRNLRNSKPNSIFTGNILLFQFHC